MTPVIKPYDRCHYCLLPETNAVDNWVRGFVGFSLLVKRRRLVGTRASPRGTCIARQALPKLRPAAHAASAPLSPFPSRSSSTQAAVAAVAAAQRPTTRTPCTHHPALRLGQVTANNRCPVLPWLPCGWIRSAPTSGVSEMSLMYCTPGVDVLYYPAAIV